MIIIRRYTPKPLLNLTNYVFGKLFGSVFRLAIATGNFSAMRRRMDVLGRGLPFAVKQTPTRVGSMEALLWEPHHRVDDLVILYCHGGGFCAGSIRSHAGVCALVARVTGRQVLSFNYRLAPEHHYPAQLDDGMEAYKTLLDRGLTGSKIVLMGDSAGGAMALSLALRLRDEGWELPYCVVALFPWIDFTVSGAGMVGRKDPMLTEEGVRNFARHTFRESDASRYTLQHAQLNGLPPVLLQIGSTDLLAPEVQEFGARLEVANPAAQVEVWEDMPHGWHSLYPFLRESRKAVDNINTFINGVSPT